jgi:thioredoxin 1
MASAHTQYLTEENFDATINSGKAVLVDFWAEWCGPCKMIGPIVDELGKDYADQAIVAKVNVDDSPELAARFGITSIPNLKIFKNGVEVGNIVGAVPKATIKAAFDKHV